jgi:HPt (histidine-containing phosphotransfer) domain-containing protein
MEQLASADGVSSVDLPAHDPAALDRLWRFGGWRLLNEMISLFLSSTPERIDAMRAAVDAGDADAAELALHSLKSSAAQLGALRMQRVSQFGELRAQAGELAQLDDLVIELLQEHERVEEWLVSVRDSAGAT